MRTRLLLLLRGLCRRVRRIAESCCQRWTCFGASGVPAWTCRVSSVILGCTNLTLCVSMSAFDCEWL